MFRRLMRCVLVAATAGTGAGMLAPVAAYANVGCGQTITTSLTLTHDLVCPGNGIVVGASNVVLNLGGHTITGPPPVEGSGRAGVLVASSRTGVTVTNGTLRAFDFGVDLHPGAHGVTISSLSIVGSRLGIRVNTGASSGRFLGNTISDVGSASSSNAMQLGGNGHHVEGNTISRPSGAGILFSGNDDVFRANRIVDAGAPGIATSAFGGNNPGPHFRNQIVGNTIAGSGRLFNSPAIVIDNGADTLVDGNSISGRRATPGVFVNNSARTVVSRNSLDNHSNAILLRGSTTATTVSGNRTVQNSGSGIFVESGPTGTAVTGNSALMNGFNGIYVLSPATTVASNTAAYNANWGIFAVAGVTDGGGNRAFGNGQPAQCTPNIACA